MKSSGMSLKARKALASKQLRLQLATCVRDRALALRVRKDAA